MDHLLEALKEIRTPIVYDAIERFGIRSRSEGTTDPSIRCILPSLGAMVGYACTGKIVGELPPAIGERLIAWEEVWDYTKQSLAPGVMVVQDLDQPPGKACAWGDVAASIFLNLGCVGAITNGGVRDIREVEKLGFHLFAPGPVVGHGYIRFVEINTPVKVGSLIVHPGDLIHADEHGVLNIPKDIPLDELLEVIRAFLTSERSIIEYCTRPGFELDELIHRMSEHEEKTESHFKLLPE
ncbi:MAG: RraA family protein [Anaerolineales bacterium]|jgi:regulator of RNase E activity RraA